MQCRTYARTGPGGESRQVIEAKNVLDEDGYSVLDGCRSIPTGFRQLTIYYDTNRILGCFCDIKP
jgi:hypothetical protein